MNAQDPFAAPEGSLDPKWPPSFSVSPGWHLGGNFTGFAIAHANGIKGQGVRIAHLDTGYTPSHPSMPRNLRADLAFDFWAEIPGAIDSFTSSVLAFSNGNYGFYPVPGHGTATLALLAGGYMRLLVNRNVFEGDFGGAPDAEVVPVRISPTAVDIGTWAMAEGINYAVDLDCDVICISHGGPPDASWAEAVNKAYDAGVVLVAAAGDNWKVGPFALLPFTTYPSAFNRVITVLGATYDKEAYRTDALLALQGNLGPAPVMEKAIAAYTPNVAWMNASWGPHSDASVFRMNGGGTSASTPQVAAACALWLSLYGKHLPRNWRRVEACRTALFESAARRREDVSRLGWGLLDVPAFLDRRRAACVIKRRRMKESPVDKADSASCLRLLFGVPPIGSSEDSRYAKHMAPVRLRRGSAAV